MDNRFFEKPILNSPYDYPVCHWELDDETLGLSVDGQKYETMSIINQLRSDVDAWRKLKSPKDWGVTPETERLLKHWRSKAFLDYLTAANEQLNSGLMRLALKRAISAGKTTAMSLPVQLL